MITAENPVANVSLQQGIVPRTGRIQSVDAIRGAIIILMALDHIRDFISSAAMSSSPTDLTQTTTFIFFTRWITHFCAPVFAFTAGIGAFFWGRGKTKAQVSRFLLTRGLWLMVLEVTVLRFIFYFQARFYHKLVVLLVFWMLGLCMVVLAALVHLPRGLLLTLSVATIALHNLLDKVGPAGFSPAAWLWDILHKPGMFPVGSVGIFVAYPLVPWFAVMAAGYCFGPALLWEPERRRKFLLSLGFGLSAAFLILRAVNVYGDPAPWSVQHSAVFTALSFLNCTKYPPSLAFLLMTLGPAFVTMAWLERRHFSLSNPVIVFGRVPFFFFVVHLAVIHVLAVVLNFLRYGAANFLLLPPPSMGSPRELFPASYGYNMWIVYLVWFAVIGMLYPLCRWYAQLKQRRHDWWLSYL